MASLNDVTFLKCEKKCKIQSSFIDDAFDDGDDEGGRGGENMDDDVVGVGVERATTRREWREWWWCGKTTKSKSICNDIDDAD